MNYMLKTMWTWLSARGAMVLGVLGAIGAGALYLLGRRQGQATEHGRQTEANHDALGRVAVEGAEAQLREDERAAELARAQAEVAATAEARHAHVPTTPEQAERDNAETAARLARMRSGG